MPRSIHISRGPKRRQRTSVLAVACAVLALVVSLGSATLQPIRAAAADGPSASVTKRVEGQLTTAPGPRFLVGDVIDVTYEVTNTGPVTWSLLRVSDELPTIEEIDCGDGTSLVTDLASDETVVCTAQHLVSPGLHPHRAIGYGNAPPNLAVPASPGPAYFQGVEAGLALEASINGDPADAAPGPLLANDFLARIEYLVSNGGEEDLTDLVVTDDRPTAEDIDCGMGSNRLAVLASGESVTCHATLAVADGPHALAATAEGGALGARASTQDQVHYSGGDASVSIEKLIDGVDTSSMGPGPWYVEGDPLANTYRVTNSGGIGLVDLVVSDAMVAGDEIDCGAGSNQIASLAAGQSVTCTSTDVAVTGAHPHWATVAAATGLGARIFDDGAAYYEGILAGITLTTSVNGDDANEAPGPSLLVGDTAELSYLVHNRSSVELTNVTVTDDALGGAAVDCGGGSNVVAAVAAGEAVTCTASEGVALGEREHTGSVSGEHLAGGSVSDDDVAHYRGIDDRQPPPPPPPPPAEPEAALQVTKQVCIRTDVCDPNDDADWTDEIEREVGDDVAFRIVAINAGEVGLDRVAIADVAPAGLDFKEGSATSSRVSHHGFPGSWEVGALAPGEGVAIAYIATVRREGRLINVAAARGVTVEGGAQDHSRSARAAARQVVGEGRAAVEARPNAAADSSVSNRLAGDASTLVRTGSDTRPLVASGLVLLGLGTSLLVLARRRVAQ